MAQDTEYRIGNNVFLAFFSTFVQLQLVSLIIFHLHVMEITEFFKWFLLGWLTYLERAR